MIRDVAVAIIIVRMRYFKKMSSACFQHCRLLQDSGAHAVHFGVRGLWISVGPVVFQPKWNYPKKSIPYIPV